MHAALIINSGEMIFRSKQCIKNETNSIGFNETVHWQQWNMKHCQRPSLVKQIYRIILYEYIKVKYSEATKFASGNLSNIRENVTSPKLGDNELGGAQRYPLYMQKIPAKGMPGGPGTREE